MVKDTGTPVGRHAGKAAWFVLLALVVGAWPALAHSGATPTILARGEFVDQVDVQIRVKPDDGATQVLRVDGQKIATVRVDVPDHAQLAWHTHPGPVIVTVAEGELTYVTSECEERVYQAGDVFIDPGDGNVHMAWASNGPAVLYATFFDAEGPLTIPAEGPSDCQSHE